MAAFDPKRTFGPEKCCHRKLRVGPLFRRSQIPAALSIGTPMRRRAFIEGIAVSAAVRGTAPRVEILNDGSVKFSTLIEEK